MLAVVAAAACECPLDGTELYLRHEDCDKFYQCTHGQKVERNCPDYLRFNEELSLCDWPRNVDCAGRRIPVRTTPSD
ncbi:unnamed protein product [Colias eurytheme]|nr:unnamed protein product [Colias eurytheme]